LIFNEITNLARRERRLHSKTQCCHTENMYSSFHNGTGVQKMVSENV